MGQGFSATSLRAAQPTEAWAWLGVLGAQRVWVGDRVFVLMGLPEVRKREPWPLGRGLKRPTMEGSKRGSSKRGRSKTSKLHMSDHTDAPERSGQSSHDPP